MKSKWTHPFDIRTPDTFTEQSDEKRAKENERNDGPLRSLPHYGFLVVPGPSWADLQRPRSQDERNDEKVAGRSGNKDSEVSFQVWKWKLEHVLVIATMDCQCQW